MRRSRVVLALSLALASGAFAFVGLRRSARAFVPPPYSGVTAEASIEGAFAVEGTEPGGTPEPGGVASIVRVGGPRYEMTETIQGTSYHATCLRRGAVLGCGWGRQDVSRGIALYSGSTLLTGDWWESGATGVGHELLAGGDPASGGNWTIVEGVDAYGATYGGTAVSHANGLIQEWTWTVGSTVWYGWGVRLGGVIAVGFNLARTCGVAMYEIRPGGGRLEGVWVDPGRPNALGTEILVRK